MQQAGEAGTGFLDAGAAALPGGWPDDAMVGAGRTPAGREVAAKGKDIDDRDAEGGCQVAVPVSGQIKTFICSIRAAVSRREHAPARSMIAAFSVVCAATLAVSGFSACVPVRMTVKPF